MAKSNEGVRTMSLSQKRVDGTMCVRETPQPKYRKEEKNNAHLIETIGERQRKRLS